MGKTIQDELRAICLRKSIEAQGCGACVYGVKDRARSCSGISCAEAAADTLLATLDAWGLEIVRKGEK